MVRRQNVGNQQPFSISRRLWMAASGGMAAGALLPLRPFAGEGVVFAEEAVVKRPRVGVVLTSFTYRSHSHVILENFLTKYLFCGEVHDPGCDVVAIYADQKPQGDMAPEVAKQFQVPKFPTVEEALCVGGKSLAVDAVLLIGEHGDYPKTEHGIVMYPRKQLFDACVAVMKKSGRVVPLFNDKHLSYRYDWSREMYDTAKSMKMPFMAGSSVPLAERSPPLEIAQGANISEAIAIHTGPLESYDFHGLEVLQSMVEFRKGGESGVVSVQYLGPKELWEAAKRGEWSVELANAAANAKLGPSEGGVKTSGGPLQPSHGIMIRYRDGLKGMVLSIPGNATKWGFAAQLVGQEAPVSTSFHVGPWNNRNLFRALSHAIQHFFRTSQSPYPVERTLLTSGVLDAMMRSYGAKGGMMETPELAIAYEAKNFDAFRENGATWKRITDAIEQPKGVQAVLPE